MKATRKRPFNVNKFLATVDGGRTISNYGKNQAIFSQGDVADSVFYIREGKVKVTIRSDQGKEAVVAIHVATRIIDLARTGERSPTRLRDRHA